MMQFVSGSISSTFVPPPPAVVPLRAPPGLTLDLKDIGPPPGLDLPEGLCTGPMQQTTDDGKSTTCCSSTSGSSNPSDSEPDLPYTYRSGIRLRGDAPAFVPSASRLSRASGKESPSVTSPGTTRTCLSRTANMFMPRLPYVPKAQVDQAWQEWTAANTQVQRSRRGVRGGRKARRAKAAVAKEEN